MKINIQLSIIAVMLSAGVFAQSEPTSMTLKQAQEYALKNSYTAKSTLYDAEVANLETKELLATGLPQIDGSMQYTNFIKLPDMILPPMVFNNPEEARIPSFQMPQTTTLGVTASQLLFNGTWLVGLEASKSYELLQQKNVRKTEIEVKEEVAKSYYLALVSAETVKILQESRLALAATLRDTEAMFDNGFMEKQDVDQLMLSVNEIDIQISYAEQQQKNVMDLLKMQIGYPISNDLILIDTVDSVVGSDDSAELLNAMFNAQGTIDYEVANQVLAMQKLNVKAKKASYLPTLATFITFQTQGMRKEFNFFDPSKPYLYGNFWGLQLNVPILSGGARRHSVSKAEVEVKRYTDMLAFTQQATELEYRSAKTEFDNANKVYESSKRSLKLATDIYNTSDIKYKEGIASSFDLAQRNTQVIQSKGAYIQAMLNLLNAKTRLTKALNQL